MVAILVAPQIKRVDPLHGINPLKRLIVAEKERFELSMECYPHTRLAAEKCII